MSRIEEIARAFGGLPRALGQQWNLYPLRENRVYLSRDHAGLYSLFLIGPKDSFGVLPRIAGIDYSDSIEAVPDNVTLQAVRLTSSSVTFGNRVMSHVAYELEQRLDRDPSVTNDVLLSDVRWILELLGDRENILSDDHQKGLVGELVFLRKLLLLARELLVPLSVVVERWHGYDRAKRDFSGPGIAVEVKTTSSDSRIHQVGSLAQLEPQGAEEVFLFSVGLKIDSSAPRKLPDYVSDVMELLVTSDGQPDFDLRAKLSDNLRLCGYEPERESLYRSCPGFLSFHLPPKLFREQELDRVRLTSFKGDRLPSMVVEVAYKLDVQSCELNTKQEKEVLRRMLGFSNEER